MALKDVKKRSPALEKDYVFCAGITQGVLLFRFRFIENF